MRKKAVVAGHMCIDMTPTFHNPPINRIDQLFAPGLIVDVGEAIFNPGGCVSNTGLAMNFFGADVHLMGRINKDSFGTMLKDRYEKLGAKLALKIDEEHPTGYTIVLSPKGIDRMFLHNAGTNEYINNEDFDIEIIKDSDIFHFGYPTLMPQYQKNDCKEWIDLYKMVKNLGVITSLDLTMPDHNSDIKNIEWDKIFTNLLPYVDIFVPSYEEIQYIIDEKKYQQLYERANGEEITKLIEIEKDVKPIAEKLISYGCAIVLIKCGPLGMYLKTACEERMLQISEKLELDLKIWANIDKKQSSFVADRVLAATGAGDTSIAAFLCSLMRGENPDRALEYAAATGASCVTEFDAISGLISFEDMRKKINNGWKTND